MSERAGEPEFDTHLEPGELSAEQEAANRAALEQDHPGFTTPRADLKLVGETQPEEAAMTKATSRMDDIEPGNLREIREMLAAGLSTADTAAAIVQLNTPEASQWSNGEPQGVDRSSHLYKMWLERVEAVQTDMGDMPKSA